MADLKKKISELPLESNTEGLFTIGINADNESVKVPLGSIVSWLQSLIGAQNQAVSLRIFLNADLLVGSSAKTLVQVLSLISAREDAESYQVKGMVLTFTGLHGIESWQWSGVGWSNPTDWKVYRYNVVELASEAAMDTMINAGSVDDTTMYFVAEE